MDVTVRAIEAEDLSGIGALEEAADQLLAQLFGPEHFVGAVSGAERVAEPGFVLVAGRPCIGFAHVIEDDGNAYLEQVSVDPRFGRRGIGTALVEACIENAQHRGFVELSLTTFRDVAFNGPWYRRLGFEIVAEPAGVLAEHVAHQARLAQLSPRVAMMRRLAPSGRSHIAAT